jgi:hypothetical protein
MPLSGSRRSTSIAVQAGGGRAQHALLHRRHVANLRLDVRVEAGHIHDIGQAGSGPFQHRIGLPVDGARMRERSRSPGACPATMPDR